MSYTNILYQGKAKFWINRAHYDLESLQGRPGKVQLLPHLVRFAVDDKMFEVAEVECQVLKAVATHKVQRRNVAKIPI